LAGRGIPGQYHAIGRVEPFHQLAAGLAEDDRQLAVHPDLGVVVDHQLEDHRRAGDVEVGHSRRQRDGRAIPVEGQTAVGPAVLQLAGAKHRPAGVVEVGGTGVGRDVLGSVGRPRGTEIRAGLAMGDLDHGSVIVAPGCAHEPGAFVGPQIHQRRGSRRGKIDGFLRGQAAGQDRQREEERKPAHHMPPTAESRPS
jgi:hypothetical protein